MKRLSPDIKLKIIHLSKCFWFWDQFYTVYSTILNVPKRTLELKFPKSSFNKYQITEHILEELDQKWDYEKIQEIVSYFYNLKTPFDKDKNSHFIQALKELKEFQQIVWKDVKEEIIQEAKFKENLKKEREKDDIEKERTNKIEEIKNNFYKFAATTTQTEKQERWYWLEKGFFEILELEWLEFSPPYKTDFEQIDWKFKFKSFDYLVEIKWTEETLKQKEVSIFDWKLRNKWQSTRWFMLSIWWIDESAISFASWSEPRIIFMDVLEFISILEQRISFYDIFTDKEDKFVRLWRVYK